VRFQDRSRKCPEIFEMACGLIFSRAALRSGKDGFPQRRKGAKERITVPLDVFASSLLSFFPSFLLFFFAPLRLCGKSLSHLFNQELLYSDFSGQTFERPPA
jgi:hypothetical protein